ncbi:MAG: hypothetical protein VXU42_03435, partial [Verrucomicrobiota bacterium]|nr:hypothetical protein [Verrucomicrobiota bacterium]
PTTSSLENLMVRRVSVAVVSEPEISDKTNSFTATSSDTPEFALQDGTPITKSMHRAIAREQGAARKREITEKCKKVYEVLDWLRNHEPAAFERVADDAIRDESDRYHTVAQMWFDKIKSTNKLTRARANWCVIKSLQRIRRVALRMTL